MLAVLLVSDREDSIMLEARLIAKLTEAKTMWDTPPHHTNDAQGVISDAISMAVDTEWESRISGVLDNEALIPFDQLKVGFLTNNPEFKDSDLSNPDSPAYPRFHEVCQQTDRAYENHVTTSLANLIEWLCSTIGDKVHRRNLQIADLKREPERIESRIRRATQEVNRILADIDAGKIDLQAGTISSLVDTLKERIGKINLALLK